MAYAIVQAVLIAAIVAFSVVQLFRILLPKSARAVSGQLATLLRREASPPILRHVGVWLTPKDVVDALLVIQKDLQGRRENRNLRKLYPFLQGLERYSGAIEVLSNGLSPYLPWIWVQNPRP